MTGGRGVMLGWDQAALANSSQVEELDWTLEVPGGSEGGTQGRLVLSCGEVGLNEAAVCRRRARDIGGSSVWTVTRDFHTVPLTTNT